MNNIDTSIFLTYLESLNLFRWSITETDSAFEAVVSQHTIPRHKHFTQVLLNEDGTFWVRLAKCDIFNELITQNFFNK